MKRIVLGLSDGVDSAVAAVLLKRQGYDVTGVFLDIGLTDGRATAERSAREAGIGFETVDIAELLNERVCKPFIDEYLCGRTPSPCVGCNREVKLPALMEAADRLGIGEVATGHYVLKEGSRLYMGKPDCDQSYMLSRLTPEEVKRLVLPLGGMDKKETRALAEEFGLSVCAKPDSRENCFIKEANYAEYIERLRPGDIPPAGNVLFGGSVVDTHDGIHRYTVGQRWKKDMGDRRAYVGKIDAVNNEITLFLWEDLFTCKTVLTHVTFLSGCAPSDSFRGRVRVRHTRWEQPSCTVKITGNTAYIETDEPLRAPAPGQSAAIYSENELLGGGIVS